MNNPQRPTDAGTFACPICGRDSPHYHSPDEVKAHRETEAFAEESLRKFYDALPDTDPLKATDAGCVELKPCPFCKGEAKRLTIGDDEPNNAGGDVIVCTKCGASSHVEFGRKENLVSRWNTRAALSASGGDAAELAAADMREAVIFLSDRIDELDWSGGIEQLEREWHGHVEPALSRLRMLVPALPLAKQEQS
jgi:Lar family restriction alleviation protein